MRSLRGFSSTSPTFLRFAGGGFTLDLFPNQAKAYVFLEFVSLPPLQPSPTGEGAVLRQIQITAAVSLWIVMKLLLFLQPMSPLPLWGRVRVGAADNSSADLGFCRVVVQVMVWKEVYCKQPLRRQAARINKVWDNNGNGNKIMQMLCDEMAFLGAK